MRLLPAVSVTGALLAGLFLPTSAQALIPPDVRCSAGRVALTFDDGPHPQHTARLLKVLRLHRAQATFYVQGQHADRRPELLRTMVRDGHAVENHSWNHPTLTGMSSGAVRGQLADTTRAIRKATGQTPHYFRPPYGATDGRIEAIGRDLGLRQQLWTVDTRDWAGLSGTAIADRALAGVRKHQRNVILLHDGVVNSPRTVDAVPAIVKGLRKRGYCLVPQQSMMARQKVRIQARKVTEPRQGSIVKTFVLRLDTPAQRRGRVLVTAVDRSAKAGRHYRRSPVWVRFKRGHTKARVKVRILQVPDENVNRTFVLRLRRPHELRITKRSRVRKVVIRDNGVVRPPPVVTE